ncbi:hypothetical protein PC112_g16376 [Phytophthora cactorum]|nr:hypothetical protein PC112_g16376 [Phytophthora cactorum]
MPQREGRPRTSGTGRKKPKHNRCSFSNRHKLEVAKHFFSGGDMKHTMQTFCPFLSGDAKDQRRKLVYKWWYMISVLEERCQSTAVADMKYVRVPVIVTILLREAEAAIVQWINLFRKEGVPISSAMLRMKGAEIADGLGIAAFRGCKITRDLQVLLSLNHRSDLHYVHGYVRAGTSSVSTIKNSFRRAHILAPLPAREQQQEEPRLPDAKVKRRVSLGTQSEAGILADKIPKAKINQILPSGLTIRGLKKESKGRAGSRCTQHLSFTDAFAPNLAANLLMDTGAYDNAILAY